MKRLPLPCVLLLAGCAAVPGDDRSASERLVDGVFNVVASPVSVVVESTIGPALDEAESAVERAHGYMATRKEREDARALCIASQTLHKGACAIAFPQWYDAPPKRTQPVTRPTASPQRRPERQVAPAPPSSSVAPRSKEPSAEGETGEGQLDWMRLESSLRRHEGLRLEPYQDNGGTWHICVGHSFSMSEQQCDALLEADMLDGLEVARGAVGEDVWATLGPTRREVLAHLGFATKLPTFKKMLSAVRRSDYTTAANEILDSLWARSVSAQRSRELANMMRTGDS